MKWLAAAVVVCLASCAPQMAARPPPFGAFYFPSGLWYQQFIINAADGTMADYLYVASANYDKRFDSGSISAVNLSSVPNLPAIGDAVSASGPLQLADLGADFAQVFIQSFAGEMAAYQRQTSDRRLLHNCVGNDALQDCPIRLFVPTRAEGDLLEIVDALGSSLTCFNGGTNCLDPSLSLTAMEKSSSGKPRAPEPIGVAVMSEAQCTGGANDACNGEVMVTHLKAADSPPKTNQNLETYVVRLTASNPQIDTSSSPDSSFISLGFTALGAGPSTSSVALGKRYAYLSSRYITASGAMVFSLDRQNISLGTAPLYDAFLQLTYQTLEARGIAIGENERRLYVAGRSPDSLVVANITDPAADLPQIRLARAIALPDGTNEVKVIPRQQCGGRSEVASAACSSSGCLPRGDLVVITSSTAGAVSIYDDDAGRLVAQVNGVGSQPFGIAVQPSCRGPNGQVPPTQARVFVSDFGDGRVAAIDVDMARPERANLVAHLGKAQTCLLQENDASCVGTTAP